MAFTSYDTKEINCKILYHGPRSAGKTENLRSIFSSTSRELQAGLLELSSERTSTQFFDFLPVSIGHVGNFHLKLHLYTLPSSTLYESVPSIILKGLDGIVFVADSRVEAMADNIRSLIELKRTLGDEGFNYADLPRVFQYNKRDFSDIVPVEVMRQELNPTGNPDHEAVAVDSKGTLETLQSMSKQVINRLSMEL